MNYFKSFLKGASAFIFAPPTTKTVLNTAVWVNFRKPKSAHSSARSLTGPAFYSMNTPKSRSLHVTWFWVSNFLFTSSLCSSHTRAHKHCRVIAALEFYFSCCFSLEGLSTDICVANFLSSFTSTKSHLVETVISSLFLYHPLNSLTLPYFYSLLKVLSPCNVLYKLFIFHI